MKAAVAVASVFFGCISNAVLLEATIKEDPGAGNLITFSQFLFIALEGFVFTSKFGTVKSRISKKDYLKLVLMFFLANVLNNYSFDFNVPVPLHIIFRSGSLIVNMILGVLVLKESYKFSKYLSVILITVGIVICTFVSGKEVKSTRTRGPPTTPVEDFFWWSIGIAILTFALFISAGLGIVQQSLAKKYGKHPKESLYYTHLLPLPLFFFVFNNIYEHLVIAFESEPIAILHFVKVPRLIMFLLGNVLTQYVCISSVFVLTTECSSLVVTLVLTLRKFASLLFSIVYFKNPFTVYHWLGTMAVFIGTFVFTELHEKLYDFIYNKKRLQKKKQ